MCAKISTPSITNSTGCLTILTPFTSFRYSPSGEATKEGEHDYHLGMLKDVTGVFLVIA